MTTTLKPCTFVVLNESKVITCKCTQEEMIECNNTPDIPF